MTSQPGTRSKHEPTFSPASRREGGAQAQGAQRPRQGIWFGLGMMGLIGWSVVVPTLLGAALGIWLDKHYPGTHSWTLALLVVGLDHRLFECVALGRQGRQGNARGTGG